MEFDFVKEMENGIVMDYAENKFIFVVKDFWSKEEIGFLKKKKGMISLIEKEQLPVFIVQIEEGLESSDCVFCLNSDNEGCLALQNYQFEIHVFDEAGNEVLKRTAEADKKASAAIYDILHHAIKDEDEALLDAKIAKISVHEPFELEEMTDLHIKF